MSPAMEEGICMGRWKWKRIQRKRIGRRRGTCHVCEMESSELLRCTFPRNTSAQYSKKCIDCSLIKKLYFFAGKLRSSICIKCVLKKILLNWGPLSLGGPVQSNMLHLCTVRACWRATARKRREESRGERIRLRERERARRSLQVDRVPNEKKSWRSTPAGFEIRTKYLTWVTAFGLKRQKSMRQL